MVILEFELRYQRYIFSTLKPDVPTDGTGRYEAVKRCIAALFDIQLLCFSDKFEQDISDKLFKYTAWKV
jgi:hypothetical protein